MKKSFLGSLIGISIILSIESLSRVVVSLYQNLDILMFSYTEYTGFWPVLLVTISAFSSFFGAMFALTYGRSKQVLTLIIFIIFGGLYRYGQILLLKDTEGLLFPVIALVLTLLSIVLAWRLVRPRKPKTEESGEEKENTDTTTQAGQKHHHPVENGGQHNPPQ